jgi:Tfp pilus assembly protein PilV
MKRQRTNQGFTLIETTVAMVVMMIVGLGATSLFLYSARYNSGGTQRSTAMAIAQQRVEVLRGTDFSDASLAFGLATTENVVVTGTAVSYSDAAGGAAPPAAPAGSIYFQLQTQVVPFPIGTAAAVATQKQITIRVVPVNGNGAASWDNLNPVEVVFRRSNVTPGPYKRQ